MEQKQITTKLPGIKQPGDYKLTVVDYGTAPSKAGNPMLTLLWRDEKTGNGIRTFHVATNETAVKILTEVKVALGLPVTAKAADFLYKSAKVIVDLQAPNSEGKIFSYAKKFLPLNDASFETEKSEEKLPF